MLATFLHFTELSFGCFLTVSISKPLVHPTSPFFTADSKRQLLPHAPALLISRARCSHPSAKNFISMKRRVTKRKQESRRRGREERKQRERAVPMAPAMGAGSGQGQAPKPHLGLPCGSSRCSSPSAHQKTAGLKTQHPALEPYLNGMPAFQVAA